MPSKSVKAFADKLATELRLMGLRDDEGRFTRDPLGGTCRRLAQWRPKRSVLLSICIYEDKYFDGSHNRYVGFGSKGVSSVESIKNISVPTRSSTPPPRLGDRMENEQRRDQEGSHSHFLHGL
ncbi:hypothetical protein ABH994_008096 [Bradyrhizobium yuanmingense]|uniref:Uncharacterized protein n=1 Tax=Bradyrhizobium yuanmingense TaxID=108015 RepID=A0ABV4G702_9BRAD